MRSFCYRHEGTSTGFVPAGVCIFRGALRSGVTQAVGHLPEDGFKLGAQFFIRNAFGKRLLHATEPQVAKFRRDLDALVVFTQTRQTVLLSVQHGAAEPSRQVLKHACTVMRHAVDVPAA